MEKKQTAASTIVIQLKRQTHEKDDVLQHTNVQYHTISLNSKNTADLLKDMKPATSSEQQRSHLPVQL